MIEYNANNERIKRQYFVFLKEAKRLGADSVDNAARALAKFEAYNKYRDFSAFHFKQAIAYKDHLAGQNNQATGKRLSKATISDALAQLKCFFQWLAPRPGYKSRLNYADAEYFNLSDKDSRIARAHRTRPAPTIEQIWHVLRSMPSQTPIEKRDRALIAFALLTGARDGAIASMKLKHVDLIEGSVFQDAREVKTKFSKTFPTYFFPVGGEALAILAEWVAYLRGECLFGIDDPLFPSTRMALDENGRWAVNGLLRAHWSNGSAIRRIFREAFVSAGLPYFHPHSFRSTLVRLGQVSCRTPEEIKAWSQNLGHESVLTTFTSYGQVPHSRQNEIFQSLRSGKSRGGTDDEAEAEFVGTSHQAMQEGDRRCDLWESRTGRMAARVTRESYGPPNNKYPER